MSIKQISICTLVGGGGGFIDVISWVFVKHSEIVASTERAHQYIFKKDLIFYKKTYLSFYSVGLHTSKVIVLRYYTFVKYNVGTGLADHDSILKTTRLRMVTF